MKRLLPILTIPFAAGPAFAAANVFCFPGVPWCDGADLGLAWIPMVVLAQLAFLYTFQGGPAKFLGRFAGHNDDWAEQQWGVMQVGLPIALLMAFPALVALAIVGRWLRPVGLLEILMVQGLYWGLLAYWSRQADAIPVGEDATDVVELSPALAEQPVGTGFVGVAEPVKVVHRSPLDAGVAAILPRAALDGIPLFPGSARPPGLPSGARMPAGASASLPNPERVYAASAVAFHTPIEGAPESTRADKVVERLIKTYMWDDFGSTSLYKLARKLPLDRLLKATDTERFGAELIAGLRAVCRHTITLHRCGVDATTLQSIVAIHAVDSFDEYAADVMQRLTYSALLERQRLFIDQTDIEIFGEEFLDCAYRLALFEVQSALTWHRSAGESQTPNYVGLQ